MILKKFFKTLCLSPVNDIQETEMEKSAYYLPWKTW